MVLHIKTPNGKVWGMQNLRTYINSLSPDEREDLARRCNTTVRYLRKLCSTNVPMGEGLCLRLSIESGFVLKPEHMRPDVDWSQLRRALQNSELSISA
jgi:hypothetical protein